MYTGCQVPEMMQNSDSQGGVVDENEHFPLCTVNIHKQVKANLREKQKQTNKPNQTKPKTKPQNISDFSSPRFSQQQPQPSASLPGPVPEVSLRMLPVTLPRPRREVLNLDLTSRPGRALDKVPAAASWVCRRATPKIKLSI